MLERVRIRPLPDIFYRDHAGFEELRKKHKTSTGPCCPVLHKVAVMFIKITGSAHFINNQLCGSGCKLASMAIENQVFPFTQAPFHNSITPACQRFVLVGLIIGAVL